MKSLLTALSGILLSIFLIACSPIYKTEYAYVPPKAKMGNVCISNCIQQKTMCEQMCQMRSENCKTRALYQFEVYKNEQRSSKQSVQKDLRDFERSMGCDKSCDCSQTFNSCYEACGGEVLERKVCIAFCDKQ